MLEMRANASRTDHYSNENLRFRKAYIRERLASMKTEREQLLAEREKIETELGSKQKPTTTEPSAARSA